MKLTKQQYLALQQRDGNRRPRKARRNHLRDLLQSATLAGLPEPEREHLFHPTRKWRFDAAWPAQRIAIEYQGGIFHGLPAHSSVAGLRRDYEKFTEASLLGWTLLLVTAETARNGMALAWLLRAWEEK